MQRSALQSRSEPCGVVWRIGRAVAHGSRCRAWAGGEARVVVRRRPSPWTGRCLARRTRLLAHQSVAAVRCGPFSPAALA